MSSKCYCVVFYTNYRKENSWKLHAVYESKQDAIDFAYTLPSFRKEYEDFVNPVGTIVFTTTCGMKHPLEMDNLSDKEFADYTKQYTLYKNESYPFDGLSWDNPKVAIIEIDLFMMKSSKKKEKGKEN
jgi:hypothetical protein